MRLSILAALSENGVIGRGGDLPWRLPAEMRRVKELTMGHCLLMGRKTFESIGRPLPGRTSIVISSNPTFRPEGTLVVDSFDAAVETARKCNVAEAFVFGGARVYAEAMGRADRLYLTRVHAVLEGDVYFPHFGQPTTPETDQPDAPQQPPPSEWQLVAEEHHPADERHAYAFSFQTFDRRQSFDRREARH